MKRNLILELISSLLILLFVYTALSKLIEPGKFNWALSQSPLISNYSKIIAWALPALELLVAALLFMPKTRLWGLYSAFGLMTVFTFYIAYMIAFTPKLPCSCGGVLQQMTWRQHLIFNIFFTIFAATGIWLYKKQMKQVKQEEIPPVIFT